MVVPKPLTPICTNEQFQCNSSILYLLTLLSLDHISSTISTLFSQPLSHSLAILVNTEVPVFRTVPLASRMPLGDSWLTATIYIGKEGFYSPLDVCLSCPRWEGKGHFLPLPPIVPAQ